MFQPSRYDVVYPFSYMYTYFVTVPHSFLTQLAFPADNQKYSKLTLSPAPHHNTSQLSQLTCTHACFFPPLHTCICSKRKANAVYDM